MEKKEKVKGDEPSLDPKTKAVINQLKNEKPPKGFYKGKETFEIIRK